MRFYRLMSVLPWPGSYLGKILAVSFVGVHVPLIALVVYLLATSGLSAEIVSPAVVLILVATLAGTAFTFAAIYALLAPIRQASGAVRLYLHDKTLPSLPLGGADEAGQLMADVQEGITRLDTALDVALAASHEARAEKKDAFGMLSQLSHDLRTPLNAIIGFSELMQNELLGPIGDKAYREYSRDINRSGEELLQTVQSILELSAVEAGRLELASEDVDVVPLFDAAVARKYMEASARGVAFLLEKPSGSLVVSSDSRTLKQMILTMLTVAIETTEAGGRVACALSIEHGKATIVVADTGRGLSVEDLPDAMAGQVGGLVPSAARTPDGIEAKSKTAVPLALLKSLTQMVGAELSLENVARGGKLMKLSLGSGRPAAVHGHASSRSASIDRRAG